MPQPLIGSATLMASLALVAASWRGLIATTGGGPPLQSLLLALALGGAVIAAYQFPLHLRPRTKVYMASVPFYLMAVLLPPPLAATAAGLGSLLGEASVQARRGTAASQIATEVGRRMVVVLLGALVAPHGGDAPAQMFALVAAALVLGVGDIVTFPLVIARVGGEPYRRVVVATAREAFLMEGAQYLLGLLGALALARQGWALVLLVWPTILVYAAFRAVAQAEQAQQRAELSEQAAQASQRVAEHAEAAQRQSEERYRRIVETAQEGIWQLDTTGRTLYVNTMMADLLGRRVEDLRGVPLDALFAADSRARVLRALEQTCAGHPLRVEVQVHHPDGRPRWMLLSLSALRAAPARPGDTMPAHVGSESPAHTDPNIPAMAGSDIPAMAGSDIPARADGTLIMATDITQRKLLEDEALHQALHDSLTGLPNRTMLHDRLGQAVLAVRRTQGSVALLLLDLDHFKEVNDTFGHHYGDLLLQEVGTRLRQVVRAMDTVARLGGDEFAVLLPGGDATAAMRVAQQIRAGLEQPVMIEGHCFDVACSIGIVLCPTHGSAAAALLRRADVAMYTAKRTRSGYALYDVTQDRHDPQRLALVSELRQAIAAGRLELHYQPQVALRIPGASMTMTTQCGRLTGVEALVRWRHPQRGPIAPAEFVPLAERTGLIKPLTEWVLASALQQCATWREAGVVLPVAVNLSAWNLHDAGLAETVARLLQTSGVPAAWLRLEVTESAIMADATRALALLTQMVELGVRVSVDDYGTGYSSLAYLKRLPADELKIDQSFVRTMAADEADATIVRSTIALGHALGRRVVAEGVESEAAWTALQAMECDAVQGYYVSRPLAAAQMQDWLLTTAWASASDAG